MSGILLIEDNESNLELMSYLLRAYGYAPQTATDGREGLAMVHGMNPDLVLCDINIPGPDGLEVARTVKSSPATRTTKLLAISALAMVGDRERILASGFDGYLSKPIDPETFVRDVAAFLPKGSRNHTKPDRSPQDPVQTSLPKRRAPAMGTILIVDDVAANRALLESILIPFGYEIMSATCVDDAIKSCIERIPDLIYCDFHMPGQGGKVFLQYAKEDAALSKIPFVVITSTGEQSVRQLKAQYAFADGFVVRPVDPAAILALTAKYLDRKVA